MTINDHIAHLKSAGKLSGAFYFKKFRVEDGHSAMKIGTDAVLLGSAAEVEGVKKILDVGTGSGIIALMLAQRSEKAIIDAIDIDKDSVVQAGENVQNSPWPDRINIRHTSLQEFSQKPGYRYDLIISNPPFFSRSLKSPNQRKNISRHNDSLTFGELVKYSNDLMADEASFWVILPVKESAEFTHLAANHGLHIHRIINIFPKEGKCQYRNIIQLKKADCKEINRSNLVVRDESGLYTNEYRAMTKEFYLDF